MFEDFKEYSVAEFFKKNRQMIGFSGKVKSLTMVVHEYFTNSMDACEEAGILPDIKIAITQEGEERYTVEVWDNGPGMPKSILGKALGKMLTGTKFNRYVQQRGQQGIGAAGCTMFSYLTTGKPIEVVSLHKGHKIKAKIGIDIQKNEPLMTIVEEEKLENEEHGLYVKAHFSDVKYDKSSYSPSEYIKLSALSNPHAKIDFIDPSGQRFIYPRVVEQLPKRPLEVKPHPLGVDKHMLFDMMKTVKPMRISTFLTSSFSRFSSTKLEELSKICQEVDLYKKTSDVTWEEVDSIVKAMRKMKWIAPPTDCLSGIGEQQLEKAVSSILNPQFFKVVERPPKVYRGGVPFKVEVAVAYAPNFGKTQIMRYANRVPLIFDAGACAITEVVRSIEWKRYNIDIENNAVILVNLSSVFVPYLTAGKQAISPEEDIVSEIKNALMEAARGISSFISSQVREKERGKKKKIFLKYVPQLAVDLAYLSNVREEVIRKAMEKVIEKKMGEVDNLDDEPDQKMKKEDGDENDKTIG